jgi:hypothetical protein
MTALRLTRIWITTAGIMFSNHESFSDGTRRRQRDLDACCLGAMPWGKFGGIHWYCWNENCSLLMGQISNAVSPAHWYEVALPH